MLEEEHDPDFLLHLYLDEKDMQPDGHTDLFPNGFYPKSCINDFPIRDHRTVLHIRRRRWKNGIGNSYSKNWELVAQGKRHSKELAAFLTFHRSCSSLHFPRPKNALKIKANLEFHKSSDDFIVKKKWFENQPNGS